MAKKSKWSLGIIATCPKCAKEFRFYVTTIPPEVMELSCPLCLKSSKMVADADKLGEWASAFAEGIIKRACETKA